MDPDLQRPAKRARREPDDLDRAQARDHPEDWDDTARVKKGTSATPADELDDFFGGVEDDLFEADLLALSSPPRANKQDSIASVLQAVIKPADPPPAAMQQDEREDSPDPFYEKGETPAPSEIPAVVGFVVGRAQRPVQLSKEALERGKQKLAEVEAKAAVEEEAESSMQGVEMSSATIAAAPSAGMPKASTTKSSFAAPETPTVKKVVSPPLRSPGKPKTAVVKQTPVAKQAQPSAPVPPPAEPAAPKADRPALGAVPLNIGKALPSTPKQRPAGTPLGNRFKPPSKVTPGGASASPLPKKGINLGMTPRRNLPPGVKAFKTPFKRDANGAPINPFTPPTASKKASPPTVKTTPTRKSGLLSTYDPVFDLKCPTARQSMRNYELEPSPSIEHLIDCDLPKELIFMTLDKISQVSFTPGGGLQEALAVLQARKCDLISEAWLRNHWSLVLWKLAGTARAMPDEWQDWWSFDMVIRQLLYRYEREINLVERSAVKRIQEHDGSAARPMILCVTRMKTAADDEGRKMLVLELTDGWYRIDAVVDECLARAARRGKIQSGRKLAVMGAKLSSSDRDGDDVMTAKKHSQLILSGNSTSLARWDAKLGYQRAEFTATLRSLSADGGNIASLEFVVIKIHPIAYIEAKKGSSQSAAVPWGEEEEAAKQAEWEKLYHAAVETVQARQGKRGEHMEDLADRLETAAESRGGGVAGSQISDDGTAEDQVEELVENTADRISIIKGMSTAQLSAAARHARQQIGGSEMLDVQGQVEQLCPRRSSRSFRIMRIGEAHPVEGKPAREGQLTVWDVKELPSDLLKEGQGYRATHLTPKSPASWSKVDAPRGEVYISTGRITKFFKLT